MLVVVLMEALYPHSGRVNQTRKMCEHLAAFVRTVYGFIPWRLFLTGVRVPEWLKRWRSPASNQAAPPQAR